MHAILNVYRESPQLVERALYCFRKHYPKEKLTVISDGNQNQDYPKLAEQYKSKFIVNKISLKSIYKEPLWTNQLFAVMADEDEEWNFIFDADTIIHRRFYCFPTGVDVIGHIWMSGKDRSIPTPNTCAVWYNKSLVEKYNKIHPETRNDVWNSLPIDYQDVMISKQQYLHDCWMPSFLLLLSAKIQDTGEVFSCIGSVPNELFINGNKFAATHPHK